MNRRTVLSGSGVAFYNAVTGCVDRGSSDGPTNLGDEGLTVGDTIDPYLDEHFRNDQHVIIPAGEYFLENPGVLSGSKDGTTLLEGEGRGEEAILKTGDDQMIFVDVYTKGGSLTLRHITFSGVADGGRIAAYASEGNGKTRLVNVNRPDGAVDGGNRTTGIFVPIEHSGTVDLINCRVENFSDNGVYASTPSVEGGGRGSVHVYGGLYKNNNISNVRLGSDTSSFIDGTAVHDGGAPIASDSSENRQNIWVRENGEEITISNVDVYHVLDVGPPIAITPQYPSGSGKIVDTRIRNDGSDKSILCSKTAALESKWSTKNVHITGTGNLANEIDEAACTGEECETPTDEARWYE